MMRRLGRELDDGETGMTRTCIVTREAKSPDHLIRFALAPDGGLVPDIRARLPGRGVWVSNSQSLVAEAVKKGAFARSLKQPVQVATDLPEQVAELLMASARQALAMANKAGLVTTGFAKVDGLLDRGDVRILLTATDAGADGRERLLRKVRFLVAQGLEMTVVALFPSSELDLALGRENAIHAAVQAGLACDAFLQKAQRAMIYRNLAATTN
jgi:uncharacterized protein